MSNRRGLLVIVSSPSGAGKTTLCRRLMTEFPEIVFSVSVTTRPAREGEKEGVDYTFVGPAAFQEMIDEGALAEWAEVHGHRYGTSSAFVAQALEGGRDVLFDIDWQGGRQLKSQFPEDTLMIWVLPPSLQVLESRLLQRATDSPQQIQRRLAAALKELEHYSHYDYVFVNDELERAYDVLRSIYLAAHYEIRRASQFAEKLVRQVRGG